MGCLCAALWLWDGSLQLTRRVAGLKMRALLGAVEAAAPMDERNGPLAHSGLENAARFPQLPQPASPDRRKAQQTPLTRYKATPPIEAHASEGRAEHEPTSPSTSSTREPGDLLESPERASMDYSFEPIEVSTLLVRIGPGAVDVLHPWILPEIELLPAP